MGFEELDQLDPTETDQMMYDPHCGVAPSEINSRATSIALASARSTPAPAPVDRQEFLVTHREIPAAPQPIFPQPPPTPTARARDSAPPMTPTPNQLVLREMTKAPHSQDQVTTMSNILQGQWLLYVNAQEKNNIRLMRIALNQAIITQDALTSKIGTERILEIANGWSAREELSHLNQAPQPMSHQLNGMHQETRHQRSLAIEAQTYNPSQTAYTLQDGDTPMRPATSQMALPPPPPPMRAPVPTRPSTGLQLEQTLAAPPIPPRPTHENTYYHQLAPPNHHQVDQYYGQDY
ncbi:hypothetical protein PCANC_21411 [Puccinia coronata f. sp. avenae]|uniref:Uncharacterized protein n=1 Tax=Puccinia coronata f. sp. avenae TaxID=200324 RepID=A0A2N5UTF2_9BASI|nr:hypothetical protein PCANC_21411 [Puccinia coronata f. sp. avenae]